MEGPQSTIAEAFEKLKCSISDDDAHNFASTRLEDVWVAAREIESFQRARRSTQNLRRIEPLLRGLEKYAKVIEVLCNGTPYMPYIWAPIKLMIQFASHHRDIFEALLTAYADIGAALPRFDRYEQAFKANLEFQGVLASVYCSILEFHEHAYKFLRKRAWHILFLSLWSDFAARFAGIIEALKKQRDFVDREAASIDILNSQEHRLKLLTFQDEIRQQQKYSVRLLEQNERNIKIAQLQHSIAWLSIDETFQEAEYERLSNQRHESTCEWIGSEKLIKEWLGDSKKNSVLWLNGKPGAGKSVMCSYVIKILQAAYEISPCYYFCKSNDSSNTCDQILRTIALQLLQLHLDLASLIANRFVYQGISCGVAQMRTLIPQLLETVLSARVVVDGIDECSIDIQKSILKELQALSLNSSTTCKIFLSSRKEVYISEKLAKKPQISLDGREEAELDIRSYAKYKIKQLRTSDTELLYKIETILVEKANGMFLWVRLVVDELGYCYSDADLEERAVSLPKGLEKAYGRILDRIMSDDNSSYQTIAIRILEWIACAYRPVKYYEVLDGLTFRPGRTVLNNKTKIRKEVLDLCRPLIEESSADVIDFVHFSAKEYILREQYRAAEPFIKIENAHFNISFSCVAYLNHALFLLPIYSADQDRATVVVHGFHGLQLYANRFWYKHLLEYCVLFKKRQMQFPDALVLQLELLLRYHKSDHVQSVKIMPSFTSSESLGLECLNQYPMLKDLVLKVASFHAIAARDDLLDQSPEDAYMKSVHADPTHFNATSYYYNLTVESLLSDQTLLNFPGLDSKQLQLFRETYGTSAYVCRYTHCPMSTDGFNTSKKRERHEEQHQRKFRCGQSGCVSFGAAFATSAQLNRHNDKYHQSNLKGASLVEAIRVLTISNTIHEGPTHAQGPNQSPQQGWQTPVSKEINVDSDMFLFREKHINDKKMAGSHEIRENDTAQAASQPPATQKLEDDDTDISFCITGWGKESLYTVKMITPLGGVLDKHLELYDSRADIMKFVYKGVEILPTDTPESLHMAEHANIIMLYGWI